MLGPVTGWCHGSEGCCRLDEGANSGDLEPSNDRLPVRLWFGTPGFLRKVDMEALVFSASLTSLESNTCV
jgi:hypothetical protein